MESISFLRVLNDIVQHLFFRIVYSLIINEEISPNAAKHNNLNNT